MIKNKYVYKISAVEWQEGKAFMLLEIANLNHYHSISYLLRHAIKDFEAGKFSYDGATFVRERSASLFEVAAFIHDWRNAMGYVSYAIDKEMFKIMIALDYDLALINWRLFYTRFTFINIIRHKLMCTYLGSVPDDLYENPPLNIPLNRYLE
jgi:hypothetical protein